MDHRSSETAEIWHLGCGQQHYAFAEVWVHLVLFGPWAMAVATAGHKVTNWAKFINLFFGLMWMRMTKKLPKLLGFEVRYKFLKFGSTRFLGHV